MFSGGMLRVALNMRCSNRCANPERPAGSSFEPTSYHTCTDTFAVPASCMAKTRRPLGSVRCVNFSGSTFMGPESGALVAWPHPANSNKEAAKRAIAFMKFPNNRSGTLEQEH